MARDDAGRLLEEKAVGWWNAQAPPTKARRCRAATILIFRLVVWG